MTVNGNEFPLKQLSPHQSTLTATVPVKLLKNPAGTRTVRTPLVSGPLSARVMFPKKPTIPPPPGGKEDNPDPVTVIMKGGLLAGAEVGEMLVIGKQPNGQTVGCPCMSGTSITRNTAQRETHQ
jgi:hypothetical protein